jgi:quercetin dioxygenase-like cupin family protein
MRLWEGDLCIWRTRNDRALARLSRDVPAALAHRTGTSDVAPGRNVGQLHSKGTVMQQRTTRVNASEETIKIGPLGIRFLLTGDDSNGSVSVFEVLVPVGQKLAAPAHKNDAYEEILYGIEGVLTWTVDGTPIEVGPGQALCIPRGAVHRFDNLGNEDVKQLAVISPAIMGPAYFREAAEVINAAAGSPPDRATMMDVFRRHGMTLAAPPQCARHISEINLDGIPSSPQTVR